MFLVILGVCLATYGDYYFMAWGFILTLFSTVLAALKTLATRNPDDIDRCAAYQSTPLVIFAFVRRSVLLYAWHLCLYFAATTSNYTP
jgi:hypothetical protein